MCNTNQRRRKGSISSDETSEESMDSDGGDLNSVSRDISPTTFAAAAANKVQNDQIEDVEDVIVIDDSPDDEPVRAPMVCISHSYYVLFLFFSNVTPSTSIVK